MKFKGIFVIGTDTEIGKTTISAGLGNLLLRRGIKTGVMKPFATGIKRYSKSFKSKDSKLLKEATTNIDNDDIINPYFYSIPTAPYLAKKILQIDEDINPDDVLRKYKEIEKRHQFTIVEGIGGLMVPLNKNFILADMAALMNIPVILVMSNKIGSINHILMTSKLAFSYNLNIKGIIINNMVKFSTPNLKAINHNLPEIIEEITGVKVLAIIPYLKEPSFNKIASLLEKFDIIQYL
jgi:dethiobiotin synthetase